MTTFFTADLHLGHENAATRFRSFPSAARMNEVIIDNWNSVVRPTDTVWLLGDAVMGIFDENVHLLGELNGTIALVPGNHDRIHPAYRDDRPGKKDEYRLAYSRYVTVCDLHVAFQGMVMSHFPYVGDHTDEDRYREFRPFDCGQILLHGHVHDLWKVNGRQINVGVDVHDFAPISLSEVQTLAQAIA